MKKMEIVAIIEMKNLTLFGQANDFMQELYRLRLGPRMIEENNKYSFEISKIPEKDDLKFIRSYPEVKGIQFKKNHIPKK